MVHEELLARFGPGGSPACSCGREHRLGLREVILGEGALGESAERASRGAARSLWVLSDGNTESAAGERWKSMLRGQHVKGRVLPAVPRPVPTDALLAELSAEAREAAPELIVAIGSGVVSDLGKAISREVGLPNWSIATAPSVDAYTSATAAVRIAGYHRPLPATPSEVVVCDLGVLRAAPRRLFLAGLGDLLAKFLARIDWPLAHLLAGEPFCELLSASALGSARLAVQAAELQFGEAGTAAAALIDASLASGLCMQGAGSSRPAASAEHTIAHFWEMSGAVTREENDLHGLLVGAAARPVLHGYAAFLPRLRSAGVDPATRRAALEGEPPWESRLPPEMARFRETLEAVAASSAPARAGLEVRLESFARRREEIAAAAAPILEELARAVATLQRLGFPFSPDEIGIAEPWRRLGVRHVRQLRDRYTLFDLAHDLGDEEVLVEAVEAGLRSAGPALDG